MIYIFYFHIFHDIQLLVVQEGSGVFRGSGVWKIPTGGVEEVTASNGHSSLRQHELSSMNT